MESVESVGVVTPGAAAWAAISLASLDVSGGEEGGGSATGVGGFTATDGGGGAGGAGGGPAAGAEFTGKARGLFCARPV